MRLYGMARNARRHEALLRTPRAAGLFGHWGAVDIVPPPAYGAQKEATVGSKAAEAYSDNKDEKTG